MSDIFISYKREDQPVARKLADALESEGWTVWWDPKLRAGERFNDVIEKALKESKCVVVMWSKRSVESQYVKHEANYALRRNKLVPVMIEEVELPFRFEDLHTLSLLDWDGSRDFSEFRRLVNDISTILGPSPAATAEEHRRQGEAQRKAEEADLPEQEREEEARRNANEDERIWRRWVEQQETEHTRVEAEVKRQGEDKRLREREKQRAEEETKRKANDENRSKDITALVVDYVANEFKKEHGVDLRNDSLALQRLKEAVEKAMRELSSIRETEINLPFITANATGPKHVNMKLTRVKLESFIEEVRRQTTRTYPSPLEFDTFVRNATTNESIRIVGITVTNKSENRLQYCSVRIEKIQPSQPDSRYWIFSDSKIARPLPTEEVFGLNPLDHRDVPIAQLDSINSRFENLGIELLCYSTQEYPALDLEQSYVLTIRGSAEIGTPIERDYKLWVDGLKQLCFKAVNAGSTASC